MNPDEIARLIPCLRRANVTLCSLTDGDESLTLHFGASHAPGDQPMAQAGQAAQPEAKPTVDAEAIGVLRLHHPHADPPAARRSVAAGDIVAFLQAGPGLRPVVAPHAGRIGEALQPDGALVGYGTPIFPYL